MNFVISGVTSSNQAFQDNCSDDDVIEVVRDEAPIEILSDGEEEIELAKQSQQQSVIQNFHFSSVPDTRNYEKNESSNITLENSVNGNEVIDPVGLTSPVLAVPYPVIALPPPAEKSVESKDSNAEPEEDTFINVTDDKVMDPRQMENNGNMSEDSILPNIDPSLDDNVGANTETGKPEDGSATQNDSLELDVVTHDDDKEKEKAQNKEDISFRKPIHAAFVEDQGRPVLMIEGHRFMKHYISRRGRTRWRCCKSFNKCRAIAITEDAHIVKLNNHHNHPPPLPPLSIPDPPIVVKAVDKGLESLLPT